MAAALDPRKIIRGFDGRLYDSDGTFLSNVNTWHLQINATNSNYQPAGSSLQVAILQSATVTLTFTETIITDKLINELVTSLKQDIQPVFGFQGKLKRPSDGSVGRYVFRQCVPDSNIDLANVQPGNELNRSWSFRCNEYPDLQKLLGA